MVGFGSATCSEPLSCKPPGCGWTVGQLHGELAGPWACERALVLGEVTWDNPIALAATNARNRRRSLLQARASSAVFASVVLDGAKRLDISWHLPR